MTEFQKRYAALNPNQKQAVDTIDGPVMVVAGPGTGKTELLSVRVANILQKTDALPQNILCLTFTESGAVAMRQRLASLIGPEAYKVAVHTFHSFGSEIINHHGEYFYSGAHFRPADELSSYELLTGILEKLPHDNPIASTMNGAYTYLSDIQSTISDLKKSGLTPDELSTVLDHNDAFCDWVTPRLQPVFATTMSKKLFPQIAALIDDIGTYTEKPPLRLIGYQPLYQFMLSTLRSAYDESVADDSTKPLSAWKRTFLTKDSNSQQALRDAKRSAKLRAVAGVYYSYLLAMQEHELYDYDDMILRVVHAMEVFADLRYDLQETYQYILVDEFQDTNDAQMRLVWNLTNNESQNGRPNLMVVGDDDQAIYRFQGAQLSNIIDFTTRYSDVAVVTLKDNYRSVAPVLSLARSVIVQGEERLETTLSIDKTLTPHHESRTSTVASYRYETQYEAHHSLAQRIAQDYRDDSSASRAIIARNHRHLVALLPHLQSLGLPLRYERQEDVLESEPVVQLELVGRITHYISTDQFDDANELVPQLLAHPAWAVPSRDIWRLGIAAHKNKRYWLEEMLETPGKLCDIAEWLILTAHEALNQPLEHMCDQLFGVSDTQIADGTTDESDPLEMPASEDFISPYRAYFFPSESLETHPGRYLAWLGALQKIRASLREFRPEHALQLSDFIEFIDLHREMGLSIQGGGEVEHDVSAITLLTAHKSKGLEFDTVYITDAQESIWGSSARSRVRLIQFPSNLPLAPAGDSDDERLRLLYVAITRAKNELVITAARVNDVGKELLPVGSVTAEALPIVDHDPLPALEQVAAATNDWRAPLYDIATATQDQLLRPMLERYKLNATHLNNFLDIPRGGPQLFLLHNLLRFPQAQSPGAAYGSAVHACLQHAHAHLTATGKRRPVEDVLHDFEEALRTVQLREDEFTKQLQRGSSVLSSFLAERYDSFTPQQIVERDFGTESIILDDVRITGKLDLIDIDTDEKTIFITDYKTGKAVDRWVGKTDYEKIKLHHYEQQLMLYKLLIENSRQFVGYTVTGGRIEFVEPDQNGKIILLDYHYNDEKIAEFKRLLAAVWKRIQSLDFSVDDSYDLTIKGIVDFEDSLLKNN